MKNFRFTLLSAVACATLSFFTNSTASAQDFKVEANEPQFDDFQSPQFSGGKQKKFDPKDWLDIEASFTLMMKPEPPSKTAERILVKWYVAVKHPEKRGALLLLTKDITHVNIPLNEEIFTSVYLSPASIKRLTGNDRAGKGAVEYVGYEILVNGVKVAQKTSKEVKGQTDWWNIASATISRSDTVPLLNKMETPFASMWWDRYAEILVERR